jgi:hypothetical protein
VQNGIENLSGTSISSNSHPEDGYRFRARTAEEIKATAHLVPQVRIEDLPQDEGAGIIVPPTARAEAKSPKGWIL